MNRKLLLACAIGAFCMWTSVVQAQRGPVLKAHIGLSNYLGDIGSGVTPRRGFISDMELQSTRLTAGMSIRGRISPGWYWSGGLHYVGIEGDDARTEYGPRRARNLHFKNNLVDLTGRVHYGIRLSNSGQNARNQTLLTFFSGVGLYLSNPKATIRDPETGAFGSEWHALQPLRTEGVSYSRVGACVPVGMSFETRASGGLMVGVELAWRFTYSDYLDDISGMYAFHPDGSLAQQLGSQASEYSLAQAGPGSGELANHQYTPSGTLRGNSNRTDGYGTLTVTISRATPKSGALNRKRGTNWIPMPDLRGRWN